jgi:hypothetical protein
MRTQTITTSRPAVLLSLLALGALGLLVGGGGGQSAAATPAATGTQAITTLETTITKHPPKGKAVRTRTVTFEFTANQPGATFECALRQYRRAGPAAGGKPRYEKPIVKPFSPCTSPDRVTVKTPKNVFRVRATVGGVTDDTPATATWHVAEAH